MNVHTTAIVRSDRDPATPRQEKTQEERSAQARQQIIEAAFICFGELGYRNTTLAHIARQAGCSRELPRYHFGSREGLLSALLNEAVVFWCGIFNTRKTTANQGFDAISGIAEEFATMFRNNSPRLRGYAVLVFAAADPGNIQLRDQLARAQKTLINSLGEIVARDSRIANSPHNIDLITAFIYSTLRGMVYQWMVSAEEFDGRAATEEFKSLVQVMFSNL